MKFVTLNICSLLNISLKYMKQLLLIETAVRELFYFNSKGKLTQARLSLSLEQILLHIIIIFDTLTTFP